MMENLETIWHNELGEASFPRLKSLRVQQCRNLKALFGTNMYQTFLSIEFLVVEGCDLLTEIIDLHGVKFEERHGTTSSEPRESSISFALQKVEIIRCSRLKHLIYAKEREAATTGVKFVFPKLYVLQLHELPELEAIYPGKFTTECPDLSSLSVVPYLIENASSVCVKGVQFKNYIFFIRSFIHLSYFNGRRWKMIWNGKGITQTMDGLKER